MSASKPNDSRQLSHYDCGPSCVDSIAGVRPNFDTEKHKGTTTKELCWWFRRRGYRVTVGSSWDTEDLRYHTSRGSHVICLVTADDGYSHWVVVWKVTKYIYYHCPTKGPQRESTSVWLSRWSSLGYRSLGIAVSKT